MRSSNRNFLPCFLTSSALARSPMTHAPLAEEVDGVDLRLPLVARHDEDGRLLAAQLLAGDAEGGGHRGREARQVGLQLLQLLGAQGLDGRAQYGEQHRVAEA
jgi:hypothetical protein